MFIWGWRGGGKFCNGVKGFVSKNLFSGEDFILRGFPYVKGFETCTCIWNRRVMEDEVPYDGVYIFF